MTDQPSSPMPDSTATQPDRAGLSPMVAQVRTAPWGFFLATGIIWIVIAWMVLRFNLTSVASVAALAGVVLLIAAASEGINAVAAPDWRWLHGVMAVVFLITSIIVFARPGNSFAWLAAFVGWYLLFKGFFDIVIGFVTKSESDTWWLLVVVGVIEVLLGFWAAGNWVRSAYLLIALVGAIALTRGVADIVMAFRIKGRETEA